jgi:hypothetical protein
MYVYLALDQTFKVTNIKCLNDIYERCLNTFFNWVISFNLLKNK